MVLVASVASAPASGGAPDQGARAGCAGGGIEPFLMMGLMFLVFYFLIIRPQQKKAKDHARMIDELKKGDQVITRGGIIGKISGVEGNIVFFEPQDKVRVRVLKSFIDGRYEEPAKQAAKSAETSEQKS